MIEMASTWVIGSSRSYGHMVFEGTMTDRDIAWCFLQAPMGEQQHTPLVFWSKALTYSG